LVAPFPVSSAEEALPSFFHWRRRLLLHRDEVDLLLSGFFVVGHACAGRRENREENDGRVKSDAEYRAPR
jgi:hypothetical protein